VYRTGDKARLLEDGSIDLIGRMDRQVKVRGIRIELGEVESVLRGHPDVGDAVVVANSSGAAGPVLVAYVESTVGQDSLKDFLEERLPAPMVPSTFVALDVLPRGATGKIDASALPDPVPDVSTGVPASTAQLEGPTEAALAQIWRDVLGIESVGPHDNFFALGGDSILSIRIIARAHEAGLRFSPREFFTCPTVSELAAIAERSG
jgi:hypothetical protein